MKIFVSYTTRDSCITQSLLMFVSKLLILYGESFIDLLHNNSSDPQKRVEQELQSADVMLLLNSISANTSEWVNWEVQQARKLRIPILQVYVNHLISRETLTKNICVQFNSLPVIASRK